MVKTFLLSGCVEVITEATRQPGGQWQLVRPKRLVQVPIPMPTDRGVQCPFLVQLIDFAPSAIQQTFLVTDDDIVCGPLEPSKEAEQLYLQVTTGIAIAQ